VLVQQADCTFGVAGTQTAAYMHLLTCHFALLFDTAFTLQQTAVRFTLAQHDVCTMTIRNKMCTVVSADDLIDDTRAPAAGAP